MKGSLYIGCFLLSINILFSIGDREDTRVEKRVNTKVNYTITKISSLTDIVGWEKVNNTWSSKNNKFKGVIRDVELYGIDSYIIEELPDYLILVISHLNQGRKKEILLIDNRLEKLRKTKFLNEEFDEIKIQPVYSTIVKGSLFEDINNFLNEQVGEHSEGTLLSTTPYRDLSFPYYIHYYSYDNKIQFILSKKHRLSSFEIIQEPNHYDSGMYIREDIEDYEKIFRISIR